MPFNLPIFLTWLRIVAIPILVGVYFLPTEWLSLHERNAIATFVFMGAALTDWLDGYLARALNQTSAFGAFLDPVADKLMVAAALIVLVQLDRTNAIIAGIIIGREITISALREWMAKIGAAKSVAVNMLGKIKTTTQMLAIPLLLWGDRIGVDPLAGQQGIDPLYWGTWLIYVAAVLTLWSMGYYLRMAWPQIVARTGE